MYNKNFFETDKSDFVNKIKLLSYKDSGIVLPKLIAEDRIRLIMDMWDWQSDLMKSGVNMSFGSRIHGNIMAVLAGVPAVVLNIDTRTKEMAEFYDIPSIEYNPDKNLDLYEVYQNLDYDKFNKTFGKKYDDFNQFLVNCGIVDEKMNDNDMFLNRDENYTTKYENEKTLEYAQSIVNHKAIYGAFGKVLKVYKKIRK